MPKKKEISAELGRTGLPVYAGRVFDEPLRKLSGDQWRKIVVDMSTNDPVIGALLNAIETLARQVTWNVEPFQNSKLNEDTQRADFIRDALFKDMTFTWQDTIGEILSFLRFGWDFPEICYKERQGESRDKTKDSRYTDGKIGWRKFASRSQESLFAWKFDEWNEVESMVQMPAPDFRLRTIPVEKALHFRTSAHKENPEGFSILRRCYFPWFRKREIENIECIGVERDYRGLPVFGIPPEYFSDHATDDQKAFLAYAVDLVTKVRVNENAGLVIPRSLDEHGHDAFSLSLLTSNGTRSHDTTAMIERYNHSMLMSVMADFLMLGTKAGGSYALSTDKSRLFTSSIGAWLDVICEQFNRYAIPRLEKLNGLDGSSSPRLVHGEVEKISLKDLGDYIQRMSGAKVTFDENQMDWMKNQVDMPITEKGSK